MDRISTAETTTDAFAEVVRAIYLQRLTGLVEVDIGDEPVSLFFRRGELFLDRDEVTALKISPLLAAVGDQMSAADSELGHAMESLAAELCPFPEVQAKFRRDHALVVELIGPLPTVHFVQEVAIHGCDEIQLIERLGGDTVQLRSSDKTPAMKQLPGLDPDMAKVLVTLAQPATPADLLRGNKTDRLPLLIGLTKLWSVGLVTRTAGTGASREWGHEVLSPRLLEQFSDRIADALESAPLDLDPATHRARLADLLSRLGQMDFYQLLGIDPKATEDDVFGAYSHLAKVVHPSHAVRLGLEGKDVASRVLFEKATEAYLTLSDPRRRASYNTVAGVHVQVTVGQAQREEEKRGIARQNFRRAASCLSEMDFSLAVDLLKEATRMDPQPEYYARLGLAQSKNPNWQHHAVASYRRAVELDPEDAGIRAGFGQLLEQMGQTDEGREQYREALKVMPGHVEASHGMERLGPGLSGLTSKSGGFRKLFSRADKLSE